MKLPIRARPLGLLSVAVGRQPFGRQVAGWLLIAREQVEQDLLGLAHHPHHPRMAVHPLLQERLDVGLRLRPRPAENAISTLAMAADVVDRSAAARRRDAAAPPATTAPIR